MKALPKILTLLFSLSLGAVIIWKMSSNMTVEPEKKTEPKPLIMGSKSAGGSVQILEPSKTKDDEKKAPPQIPRPLLPGSKSGIVIPQTESE